MNQAQDSLKNRLYDKLHRFLGKSSFFSRIAVSLNHHTRKVFKYHLMDRSLIDNNGEGLLVEKVASHVHYFVDVGANKGEWTDFLLKYNKQFKLGILYEPNQDLVNELKQKFSQADNLLINNQAVGEEIGTTIFYQSSKHSNLSSLVFSERLPDCEEKMVEITTLDAEFEKYKLEKIDFLKIDVEGYDLQVIKGAKNILSQGKVGLVQFEYGRGWANAGSSLKYAIKFLEACGYHVYLLKKDGMYEFRYDWYGEYLEYSNFVAISPAFMWLKEQLYQGII